MATEICLVCEKTFEKYGFIKKNRGGRSKLLRPARCKTCSKTCSRIYVSNRRKYKRKKINAI